jgi:molecular chaperone HtpG
LFETTEASDDVKALCAALKEALGAKVSDVAVSARLKDAPAMLAAAEGGPDLAMQRLLKRAGRPMFSLPPKLEINPGHKLVQVLAAREDKEAAAGLLLDLAKLQEGDLPDDPTAFVKAVAAAIGG